MKPLTIRQALIGLIVAITALLGGNTVLQDLGGGSQDIISHYCDDNTNTATSTGKVYKTAGAATSTCDFMGIGNADLAYLQAMVESTSTPATLSYDIYQSNDTTPTNRDWYFVESGSLTFATTTDIGSFRAIVKTNFGAEHYRIKYTVNSAAANVFLKLGARENN